MRDWRRSLAAGLAGILIGLCVTSGAFAQALEITKADITKQKSIDASQISVLGVRLGEAKDQALKLLQQIATVKVQEDQASGRIFVLAPPTGNSAVMSLKVVENQVTTINLVGGFGEWLQGDTRLLFRAFEDDSLRHKLLGREDAREVVRGGTKEAPAVDITYAYFKEGILLHSSMKQLADSKQVEARREMVLLFPARSR